MALEPQPCDAGGSGAPDVEQTLLCDVLPDGEIAGTALAVYEYDETGSPVGPPTFVDPATGLPYVAQGILQPCPGDVGCGAPTQFCFQSTAPVDQPGRMYDTTLTIAQGFAVQGIIRDLVDTPVNILWEVTDPDGTQFATNLQTALQSQFPGQTVTVTPGVVDPCSGGTADFAIHIECLRLDQDPTTLLQLRYNAGRDLIINPAFLANPPTNQFAFMKRQDGVSPVASVDVQCTNIANRGWETNDKANSFETWGPPGSGQNTFEGTTPTPRGTVVQEINSFGSGPTPTTGANAGNPNYGINPDTIWQTFVVPVAGNFNVRVVVGGRATTENIPIKLSTGDVGDAGIGDIINTSVNAGKVTNENATPAGPWTTFNQVVPLAAGTYTLAFTGPENQISPTDDNAFGGLFTDMRVFQDAPNTIQNFTNDDDTCVVPTTETSTVCEFWAPRCSGGEIVGWYNVADGQDLTNAQFWAQVPAPTCCSGTSGEGSSSVGNLVYTYLVCGTLNGESRTMSRVVVSDQAGGIIADSFVDTDGAPVTPDTWQPGDCGGDAPTIGEFVLCDDNGPFVRKLLQNAQGLVTQVVNVTLDGDPYAPVGTVERCGSNTHTVEILCDVQADGATVTFERIKTIGPEGTVLDFNDATLDGAPYVPTGTVGACPDVFHGEFLLCDSVGDFDTQVVLNTTTDPTLPGNVWTEVATTNDGAHQAPNRALPAPVIWNGSFLYFANNASPGNYAMEHVVVSDTAGPGTLTVEPGFFTDDFVTNIRVNGVVVPLAGVPGNPANQTVPVTWLAGDNTVNIEITNGGGPEGIAGTITAQTPNTTPPTLFIRKFVQAEDGTVLSVTDLDIATGAPYTVVGTVAQCQPDRQPTSLVLGEVCYAPPVATQQRQAFNWQAPDSVTGAAPGPFTFTQGPVTEVIGRGTGTGITFQDIQVGRGGADPGPNSFANTIDLGAMRDEVQVEFIAFGTSQGEALSAISPPFDTITGQGTATPGNTGVTPTAADGTIVLGWNGPVQNIAYTWSDTGSGASAQRTISWAIPQPGAVGRAAVVRCDGCAADGISYVDVTTGRVLDIGGVHTLIDCPAAASQEDCCPVTVAEVCLANGHPGVILRDTDGTLTRVDTITGLTFADADVVSCAPTVNAQARLLAASQSWTPGTDVVGTLTGLTVTGLTGTFTVTDQSGTAAGPLSAGLTASWNNDEEGTLLGPQSITTAAASTALVTWTQR